MKIEDLVIRLKIEEDNKIIENKSHWNQKVLGIYIGQEAPTKDNNRKKSNGQKLEHAKKKFKGNFYNCGRLVTSLLTVLL